MPIFSTGNKNFSVYIRAFLGPSFLATCDAFVLSSNGVIARWNEKQTSIFEGWVNFNTLAVNANESAIIECTVQAGTGEGTPGDSFISAVKGF